MPGVNKFAAKFGPYILLLAVALCHLPSLSADFVSFDDDIHITDNPYIVGEHGPDMAHFWRGPHKGLYMPATYSLWIVQAMISGPDLNPFIFHLANLLVHLANVLLVFFILRRILSDPVAALAGAALFGLHPLQVESVAWVSEFKGLLAVFFGFSSIVFYLRSKDDLRTDFNYILAFACFVLAMLSKPAAAAIPLMLFFIAVWGMNQNLKTAALKILPWLVVVVPVAIVAKGAQADSILDFTPPDIIFRPLIALDAISFYVYKILFPMGLGLDYGRNPDFFLHSHFLYWSWLPPLAMVAAVVAFRRRIGFLKLPMAVFTMGLAPVLGIIPFIFQAFSTVADRYVYLPMLGAALALGQIWQRVDSKIFQGATLAVVVIWGMLSFTQAYVWENSLNLYANAVEITPQSHVMQYNLGKTYKDLGQPDQAIIHYEKCLELAPDYFKALNNLAWLLSVTPGNDAAYGPRAVELATKANEMTGWGYPELLDTLGSAYARNGDFPLAVQAEEKAMVMATEQNRPELYSECQKRLELFKSGKAYNEE